MGIQKEHHQLLSQFTTDYNLEPIVPRLSVIIKESLNNSLLKILSRNDINTLLYNLVHDFIYNPP